jgi:hypothetical protein
MQTEKQDNSSLTHIPITESTAGADLIKSESVETTANDEQCIPKLGLGLNFTINTNLGVKFKETTAKSDSKQPWIYPLPTHSSRIHSRRREKLPPDQTMKIR